MKELTREDFMTNTGVFITHSYYQEIEEEFLSSKLSPLAFCNKWYDNYNTGELFEIEFSGKIKICIHDDDISHLTYADNKDLDDLDIFDLLSNLSKTSSEYYNHLQSMVREVQEVLAEIKEIRKDFSLIQDTADKTQLNNTLIQDSISKLISDINHKQKSQSRMLS